MGSSPHARGTRNSMNEWGYDGGIIPACAGNTIPACAGNTYPCSRKYSAYRDHPRMRGEHSHTAWKVCAMPGSSPHARGTPTVGKSNIDLLGIIPACAGNTTAAQTSAALAGDHPRMRGEHSDDWRTVTLSLGSSPHARGTPSSASLTVSSHGIIPACAGNTQYAYSEFL